MYVAGYIHTNLARIVASSTAPAPSSRPAFRSASETIADTCSPMSANTNDSSSTSTDRHTAASCSRVEYLPRGALCPMYRPATTTASTPETCATSSAIR